MKYLGMHGQHTQRSDSEYPMAVMAISPTLEETKVLHFEHISSK